MPERPNPYTPGAGDRPRALVGRELQLSLAGGVRTQVEAGYAANCLLFTGLRGTGKTVLLKEVRDRMADAGWCAVYLQIRPSAPVDVVFGETAERLARTLAAGPRITRAVRSLAKRGGGFQLLGQGITVNAGGAPSGYRLMGEVLSTLCAAAAEDGVGVAVILDELQTLKLAQLGDLVHMIFDLRDELPLAFIGGGLPYLPSRIARASTSTERLRYEPIDFLDPRDALRGIALPAELEGVTWEPEAARRVVERAGGYPYFLQLYASETWNAALIRNRTFATLQVGDVEAAVVEAARQLDAGLYRARLDRLGASQRAYVFAMAELLTNAGVATVSSSDVARRLGRSLTALSPVREGLIHAGTVHSPARGELEFAIPGFAAYLARTGDGAPG